MALNLQEPSFKAFQAADEVQFVAQKDSRALSAKARVVILAFNVAGQYGLHFGWRLNVGSVNGNPFGVNGLSNASAVQCGPPPACGFNTSCTTIWFQPSNMSCIGASAISLHVNEVESNFADETLASIVLDMRAQGVAEGRYPFTLHLPIANSTAWQYHPINGMLDVVGIADASQSEASVCQSAMCASAAGTRFSSTNDGGVSVVASILAKDADGLELNRAGEAIFVVLFSSLGVAEQTVPATYSPASKLYTAEIAGLTVAGQFSVSVQTPLGSDVKATFTVVCAAGYEAAQTGECVVPRSACERVTTSTNRLAFSANNTLELSGLGTAVAVELLPLTQATRFEVLGGRATIIFERPGSFLVQIIAADSQACTLAQARLVTCPPGYEAVNEGCQRVQVDDVCSGLTVRDSTGATVDANRLGGLQFPVGERLQLSPPASRPASAYRFELLPIQGTVTGGIGEPVVLDRTGPFSLTVQYTVAGRTPVRCSLVAALNVTAPQLCDQLQAEYSLANSAATGARSKLQVQLTVPAGVDVSAVATPLDSTLRVPLTAQQGSAGIQEGSVVLPSTGPWQVAVGVGQEQCTKLLWTANVDCLNGFLDLQRRCICPEGRENVQGVCVVVKQYDPCQDATIRGSSAVGRLGTGSASLTLGTKLSVSVRADAASSTFRALLVPAQGTEVHNLEPAFAPSRTGTFSLELEHTAAGGTPKRCTLVSSLTVVCPAGEQDVHGKCHAITQSACEMAAVDVILADDVGKGAQSLVKATLSLPYGANASLVATPLQTAVEVRLVRNGMGTWEGESALPSTGAWTFQLSIGQERCPSRNIQVGCMAAAGFIDDGSGRCVCPALLENEDGRCIPVTQEADACQLAKLVSSDGGSGGPFRPGTQLSVLLDRRADMGYQIVLIPAEGTETRNVSDGIWLNRTGEFQLSLKAVSGTSGDVKLCTLRAALRVACRSDEQEVDGECRARQSCTLSDGLWFDAAAQKCKKRPLMTARSASTRLQMRVPKINAARTANGTAEIRLASGDANQLAPVHWTATSSARWLRLPEPSGLVTSDDPVSGLAIVVDMTGQSGPLRSSIDIESRLVGRADLFENSTGSLTIEIEVIIEARAYLKPVNVFVRTRDGSELGSKSEVRPAEMLKVAAHAFDCDGLPILALELTMLMGLGRKDRSKEWRNVTMQNDGTGNVFFAEVVVPDEVGPVPVHFWRADPSRDSNGGNPSLDSRDLDVAGGAQSRCR